MERAAYNLGFSTQAIETDLHDLPVQGTVPQWLSGMLIRTAPAKYEVAGDTYQHWFDGLAMLHRFDFAKGHVCYSNRFLHSCAYREALQKRRISRPEFATTPRFTWLERVAHWIHPLLTDNCNVSVNKLGDHIVVFTETPRPIRLDPQTLTARGHYSYGEHVRGALSIAHPHLDYERHCHYTYVLEFGRVSRYHLVRIDAHTGRPSILTSIAARTPAYIHTIGMSARHLLLAEFPLVVDPLRLRFSSRPFIRNYRWQPQLGTRFHVIDKDTGAVKRVAQARAFFAFHHVNAFDVGNEIVADVVAFPDADVINQLYLERLRSQVALSVGKLTRFRIGPRGDVREEELSTRAIELPRIYYAVEPVGLIVTSMLPATKCPASSSIISSSSTCSARRPSRGAKRIAIRANLCSSRDRAPSTRTMASCSVSCSMQSAARHSCWSQTLQGSTNWREYTCLTLSRSVSTATFSPHLPVRTPSATSIAEHQQSKMMETCHRLHQSKSQR
jgi:beta,beta-carotene 9',10'-dioxygenase